MDEVNCHGGLCQLSKNHMRGDACSELQKVQRDHRDSMRNLMWHQNQKALSDFVVAILDEPRT